MKSKLFKTISGKCTTWWVAILVLAAAGLPRSVTGQSTKRDAAAQNNPNRGTVDPFKGIVVTTRLTEDQALTNPASFELPSDAREQLEKQTAAMRAIYLNFDEERLETDADHPPGLKTYSVLFEGNQSGKRRHTVLHKKLAKQGPQD